MIFQNIHFSLFRKVSLALPVRIVRMRTFLEKSVTKVGSLTSYLASKNVVMY